MARQLEGQRAEQQRDQAGDHQAAASASHGDAPAQAIQPGRLVAVVSTAVV
jgi:hypothetical protein